MNALFISAGGYVERKEGKWKRDEVGWVGLA